MSRMKIRTPKRTVERRDSAEARFYRKGERRDEDRGWLGCERPDPADIAVNEDPTTVMGQALQKADLARREKSAAEKKAREAVWAARRERWLGQRQVAALKVNDVQQIVMAMLVETSRRYNRFVPEDRGKPGGRTWKRWRDTSRKFAFVFETDTFEDGTPFVEGCMKLHPKAELLLQDDFWFRDPATGVKKFSAESLRRSCIRALYVWDRPPAQVAWEKKKKLVKSKTADWTIANVKWTDATRREALQIVDPLGEKIDKKARPVFVVYDSMGPADNEMRSIKRFAPDERDKARKWALKMMQDFGCLVRHVLVVTEG